MIVRLHHRNQYLKLTVVLLTLVIIPLVSLLPSAVRAQGGDGSQTYLPLILRLHIDPIRGTEPTPTPEPTPIPPLDCNIDGTSYGTLSIEGSPSDREAHAHADLNLALRGYERTSTAPTLVDYNGSTDPGAPQLPGLFGDRRTPTFTNAYRVFDWDWSCNCRSNPIAQWPVTLLGAQTREGEPLSVPDRAGGDIGWGYKVLVLYATDTRITLKYTREDNVIYGYTVHVENVCVEPDLLALYQQMNAQGRRQLPALYPGQPFGRATGGEVGLSIRDAGSFMDPRSRKDWWQGR